MKKLKLTKVIVEVLEDKELNSIKGGYNGSTCDNGKVCYAEFDK
jgi:natural product precursor